MTGRTRQSSNISPASKRVIDDLRNHAQINIWAGWSSLRRKTSGSVRPDHLEHVFRLDLEIVALAAGADDRTGEPGLVDAILDEGLVDVHGDDLAEGHPGLRFLAVGALQLEDLRHLALESDRAFRDPGHVDELAGDRRETSELELIDIAGDVGRGRVHLLRQVHGGEIPDELAGILDIAGAILPVGGGEADDRRHVAEGVEKAVRRQIDVAAAVARRDPPDRARRDDRIE